MELHPHELIHRVLQHVLPKGLTRVRHYGYLSPAAIKKRLLIRALLGELGEPAPILPELPSMCCNAREKGVVWISMKSELLTCC